MDLEEFLSILSQRVRDDLPDGWTMGVRSIPYNLHDWVEVTVILSCPLFDVLWVGYVEPNLLQERGREWSTECAVGMGIMAVRRIQLMN